MGPLGVEIGLATICILLTELHPRQNSWRFENIQMNFRVRKLLFLLFRLKFPLDMLPMFPPRLRQQYFQNCLTPNRLQAIMWTNINLVIWRIFAQLVLDGSIIFPAFNFATPRMTRSPIKPFTPTAQIIARKCVCDINHQNRNDTCNTKTHVQALLPETCLPWHCVTFMRNIFLCTIFVDSQIENLY